jgi:hypothetical protein
LHDETLIQDLLNKLGFFIKTITNRALILVGESVIPKQTDPYIMIEPSVVGGPNWHSNEFLDDQGRVVQTSNSQINFIVTTAKSDVLNDARKIKASLHLPWVNYEYFKDPRFAFASCTDPIQQRIPIDYQTFETRARFVITFNVCFVDTDYGAFENIDEVKMKLLTKDVNFNLLTEVDGDVVLP